MRLSDEQLTKYQDLYVKTFGVPISRQDARVEAMALLRLVRVLAKPRGAMERTHADTHPRK